MIKSIQYLLVFHVFMGSVVQALGQSQGPNSPATSTSTTLTNGKPWSNPTNALVADNANASAILNYYSTCSGTTCYATTGLAVSNVGFSIPASAVITGILVEMKRGASGAVSNQVYDSSVMILKNLVPLGVDHASATAWTAPSSTYYSYGSSTDVWGTSWTPADINDVNFGVQLMVRNTHPSITPQVNVDHIRITIYYSTSTAIASSDKGIDFTICPNPAQDEIGITYPGVIASLKIMNQYGALMHQENNPKQGENFILDVSSYAKGVYFVQLNDEYNNSTIKKMIIHH